MEDSNQWLAACRCDKLSQVRSAYNGLMHADLAYSSLHGLEWRHGGRYFLLAVVLHVVVLFAPTPFTIGQLDVPLSSAIQARLIDQPASPPPATKPPTPMPPAKPRRQPLQPMAVPRQIIAVAPDAPAAPASLITPVATVSQQPAATNTSAAAAPAPAAVSAARFNAAYLNNPEPKYPPLSRRLGEEGKVLLKVRVLPDGHAASVDLEKSSGFERLDESAKQAVTRWRFIPAKRGDEPIEASVIVPIVFRLDS